MSVEYCYKHHQWTDTDFEIGCHQCQEDEAEREEQEIENKLKEDLEQRLHYQNLEQQHHNLMIEEQFYNIKKRC